MSIKDFKAGQTVWIELIGFARRGKTDEQCIEEWEITSVGRKYIKAQKKGTAEPWGETTFKPRMDSGTYIEKSDYSPNYILYATRKDVEENIEKNRLYRSIEKRFRFGSISDVTLEQLRAIKDILGM